MIIKNDISLFQSYLTDASGYIGNAQKLYIPENKDELIELVKDLYKDNINITIAGAGTGLTGSRVPQIGVVISLEKFNDINSFDEIKKTVNCGSGLLWKDLNNFLEDNNYFLPPNPTEYNSSIGGNISCNSSGSRTYKYGSTRNYVEELEIILPNGELLFIDRKNKEQNSKNGVITVKTEYSTYIINTIDVTKTNTKNASGYFLKKDMHLIDLFIGAEGTLGIILEAKLSFLRIPDTILGLIIYFDEIEQLLSITKILKSKSTNDISPRLIEYFDINSLKIISEKYQVPKNANNAIWIEQEIGEKDDLDFILQLYYNLIEKHTKLADNTWVALDDKEHNLMKEFRHYLPLQIYENLSKSNLIKVGTDCAVEDEYFEEYFKLVRIELNKLNLYYVVFGHIGNNHLHINLFGKNEVEKKQALNFYEFIIDLTIKYKGTISAEHGIGKLKKVYFLKMYENNIIDKMKEIKLIFDSKNLLNKGNIFDL